jgi:hypothetical protein
MPKINITHRWLKPNPYMKACMYDFNTFECFRQYDLNIKPQYFLVETNYSDNQTSHYMDLFSYVDTYCIELLQKSQAKFIFDSTSEGSNGLEPKFIQLLEQSATKHNIPHQNIFYLTIDTAEAETQSSINVFYFNSTIYSVSSKSQSFNNQTPTQFFSCLNRKPRYWRSRLQYELLQSPFAKKILYSHQKVSSIKDFISRPYNKNEEVDNAGMTSFYKSLPENFYNDINIPCLLLDDVYLQVAFDVAMLSVQDRQEEIIDEKVFKPMLMKKPVILWGVPGINTQGLEKLGFKTYEDWFNLSFDVEPDTATRLLLIKEEILRVCTHLSTLTDIELDSWCNKNQQVLEHNYNLVRNFTVNDKSIKRFIEIINVT